VDLTPEASASAGEQEPGVGETVVLAARLPDGAASEDVAYRWFQTYGRVVEIIGADSAEASFVVPSVPEKHTRLSFRVDVIGLDGTIYSGAVELEVEPDPEYQSGEGTGSGTEDDDPLDLMSAETDKAPSQRAAEFEDLVENQVDANGNQLFTTASGLQYVSIQTGDGDRPSETDSVRVHYAGYLFDDGSLFDSSIQPGSPSQFGLGGVIDGWTEGLQLMTEGSYYRFVIPSDLGYGDAGSPPKIPGGATLVFDVYLLEIAS
jgi:FKBP-type peptidyl-prolyl cis-trans isomerase